MQVTIYAQIKMFNFATIAKDRKLRQQKRVNKFIKHFNRYLRQREGFYVNLFRALFPRHSNCNQQQLKSHPRNEKSQLEKCFNIIVRKIFSLSRF